MNKFLSSSEMRWRGVTNHENEPLQSMSKVFIHGSSICDKYPKHLSMNLKRIRTMLIEHLGMLKVYWGMQCQTTECVEWIRVKLEIESCTVCWCGVCLWMIQYSVNLIMFWFWGIEAIQSMKDWLNGSFWHLLMPIWCKLCFCYVFHVRC